MCKHIHDHKPAIDPFMWVLKFIHLEIISPKEVKLHGAYLTTAAWTANTACSVYSVLLYIDLYRYKGGFRVRVDERETGTDG